MDSYTYRSDSPSWADPMADRVRERLEQSEHAMWLSHPERADPPLPPNALQNVLQAQAQALNSPSTSSLRLDLGHHMSPRFDDGADTLARHASPRRAVPSLPDLRRAAHASSPLPDADTPGSALSPRMSSRSGVPPMPADAALHVAKAKEQVARAPVETPSRLSMRRFSSDDSSEDEIPSPYERPPTPHSFVRRTRASPLPNGSTPPLESWGKTRSPPRARPALRRTVSTVTIVRKTSSRVVPESLSPDKPPVPPVPIPGLARNSTKPPTPPQPGLADWTSALDTLDAFEPQSLGLWGDPEPDASAGTVVVHDDASSESAFEAPLRSPPVPQEPNQSQIRLVGGRGGTDSPRATSVGSPWLSTPVSSPRQRRVASETSSQDAARMSIQTLTRGTSTPRTVSTPRAAASGAARPPPEPTSVPVGAGEYHAPMAELQQLSLSPSAPPTEPADESADEPSAGDMASTVETAGPTPPSKDHDMVLPEPGTGPKMQATHMQPTGAPAEARAAIDEAPAQGPAAPQELAAAPSERVEQPVAETEAPSAADAPRHAAPATSPPRTPPAARESSAVATLPPATPSFVPSAGTEGPWSVFASPVRLPPVPVPVPRAVAPDPPASQPSLPNTPTRQGASRAQRPTQATPTASLDSSPTKGGRPGSNPFRRPGSTSSRADLSSHSSEPPGLGLDASPAAVAGAAAFFQRRWLEKPTPVTRDPSPDTSGMTRSHYEPDVSLQTMPGGGPLVSESMGNEWASMMLEPQDDDSEVNGGPAALTPRAPDTGAVPTPPALPSPVAARELTGHPGTLSPPLTSLASSPVLRMLGSPAQDTSPLRAVDGTPSKKGVPVTSVPVQSTPPAPSTPSHASKKRAQGSGPSNDSPLSSLRRGPSMALPGTYVPSVSTSHPPTTPPTPSTRGASKSNATPTRSTPSRAPAPAAAPAASPARAPAAAPAASPARAPAAALAASPARAPAAAPTTSPVSAPAASSPPRMAPRTARDYPGLQPQPSLVAPFELQNRSLVLPTGPDVKRPPGGFCLECMMRDEDMIDVKVDDPAVWERESDVQFYEAIRWEHKAREKDSQSSTTSPLRHPMLGTPLTHVAVRQVASGDELSVANLREHTATSRLSTTAKARTVQMFVKQQRRILGLDDAQDVSAHGPAPTVPPPVSPVATGASWPAYLSPVLSVSPQPNPYATPPLSGARAPAPVTLATITSQASHGAPASPVSALRSPPPTVPTPGLSLRPTLDTPATPRTKDTTEARSARKSGESARRTRPLHSSPERPSTSSSMRSPKRREASVRRDGTPASPAPASPAPAPPAPTSPAPTSPASASPRRPRGHAAAPVPPVVPADAAGEPDAGLTSELSMDDGPDDAHKKSGQPLRGFFRKKIRGDDGDSMRSRRRAKTTQVSPDLSMDDDDAKSFWKRLSRSPKSNSSHKSGRFASVKLPPPPPVPPVPPNMSPATATQPHT